MTLRNDNRLLLLPTALHRRRRAPRRDIDAARHDRDAGLHAGRHAGDREGRHLRRGAPFRRRHRACQHLSPDAAARRGAHRRARRAAQVHELAAADPHRFRRLPGHVAVGAAQDHRQGRHLSLAHRRRHGGADARARHRDPVAARRRHFHAARRVHQTAVAAARDRARNAAVARLGGALQARIRKRVAWPCAVRHRAGRRRCSVARPRARRR